MDLAPPLADWLARAHGAPTPAQARTVPLVKAGEHVLLSSPTGSGKTLAAFLGILDALHRDPPREGGIACVYVSPLKALVNDMARNLAAPIEGAGLAVRVAIRTGDTPQAERQRQVRSPPHVLVTTPESLALLLASPVARRALVGLRWLVVDEIHAIAESKRGAQMALTLERLAAHAGEYQRIGLSATVRPVERVAAFLGGDRPVRVVEVPPPGAPELEVALAAPLRATELEADRATLELVRSKLAPDKTTLVFTNTRRNAERIARELGAEDADPDEDDESVDPEFGANEDVPLAMPHHGSMSKESRLLVEERLKRADVRCVVASSSLELGIHAGHVDHVVLLGSPKSSARTLQRLGRSGHTPGATSRATLVVQDPADLVEARALQRLARERRVEDVRIPAEPLDVLMQHVAALRLDGPADPDAAFELTRRAMPFRDLARETFESCVAHLRHVPRMVYTQNAGTIPETGLMKVFHGERYVGEVEEEFVETLQEGDTFLLAGEPWRHVSATPRRLSVAPARGRHAAVPAWRGEGLGASALVAQATADEFLRLCHVNPDTRETESQLDEFLALQRRWGHLPRPDEAPFELTVTDGGARALVAHAWLGRRANEALALALAHRFEARSVATDWGFALLAPRAWKPTRATVQRALRAPLEPALRSALAESDLLERRFRHVATRSLVLPRMPDETLTQRQRKANAMLERLTEDDPTHPVLVEAWREALHHAHDLGTAEAWRAEIAAGARPLRWLDARPCPSPLAARILAPPAEGRREALRDNAERVRDITIAS